MLLVKKELPASHKLYLISDLHIGSKYFMEDSFIKLVQKIMNEKNSYVILLGDLIESICIDDSRFDMRSIDLRTHNPILQAEKVIELLTPIKNQIVCILEGNHEKKLHAFGYIIRDYICTRLNCSYGGLACKITIQRKRSSETMYKIYATHGFGTINSTADDLMRRRTNMMLSLKRKLVDKAGDCEIMCMGHTHRLLVCRPYSKIYFADDGTKIVAKKISEASRIDDYIPINNRWYINAGSFVDAVHAESSYIEHRGYDPLVAGYVVITVSRGKIKNVEEVIVS
jgi:UDP-2,3-diacylglucosamine pyrophosphatase LpxH